MVCATAVLEMPSRELYEDKSETFIVKMFILDVEGFVA